MIMKPALTLDDAKQLLAAAEEEAQRQGWEVVISVLNDGGRIIAVHRMDGARPGNDDISLGKANTAAMTARPSSVWERWIQNDHKAYATFGLLAAAGGVPIIIDDHLVGAMGVSGVKALQDEQIALHAINTVFPEAATARVDEESD
ncbi:MAG: GlcG/HbpS family heme-binding protein [Alphaproteobacteria bacterium]|jgi:glc operon protein GlcG